MSLERYHSETNIPVVTRKDGYKLIKEAINTNGLSIDIVKKGYEKGEGYHMAIALQLALNTKVEENGWTVDLLHAANVATKIALSNASNEVTLPAIKSIYNGSTVSDNKLLYSEAFSDNKFDSILAKSIFIGNVLKSEVRNALQVGRIMEAEALIENNLVELTIAQQKILSNPSWAVDCVNLLNKHNASPFNINILNASIELFKQNDKHNLVLIDEETGILRRKTNEIKTQNYKDNIYAAADNLGNGIGATVGGTVAATLEITGGIAGGIIEGAQRGTGKVIAGAIIGFNGMSESIQKAKDKTKKNK